MPKIDFDNSYARLPTSFFRKVEPQPLPNPKLIRVNLELAGELGIDPEWLQSKEGVDMLVGNSAPKGAASIALAYSGHQFGNFSPSLGDGRATLIGEVVTPEGKRFDLQTKGSGKTPFSRGGDGRAPLGPALREYLISESMHALGVPTTRTLAVVSSDASVRRQEVEPAAVVCRVARSHIRVGTFEYFASQQNTEDLSTLLQYALSRHFPDRVGCSNPALALLQETAKAQGHLVAQWQLVGFIHGVMNTDNVLVSGDTIDYGPCAFLNEFDPHKVYSSIDRQGRYAFGRQPAIGQWNLVVLANALAPLMQGTESEIQEAVQEAIGSYEQSFHTAYLGGLKEKLGLVEEEREGDNTLVKNFMQLLQDTELDYTLTFRHLSDLWQQECALPGVAPTTNAVPYSLPPEFSSWTQAWMERLASGGGAGKLVATMRAVSPAIIPRNQLVDKALKEALSSHFCLFHDLVERLARPFEYGDLDKEWAKAPSEDIEATFCGT